MVRFRAVLYTILLTTFLVSFILAFTFAGFPYSDNKSDPRLQRFRVLNSRRTFYDFDGNVTFSDSGFVISTIDRNSDRTLEETFGKENLIDWTDDERCGDMVYCGLPLYRFTRAKYLKSRLVGPTVTASQFKVVSTTRNRSNESEVTVEFALQLNSLTLVYMSPGQGWNFKESSMSSRNLEWRGEQHRFSVITTGKKTKEFMNETVVLEVSFD